MSKKQMELLHGTAVAIGDHGILLTGKSGSGKSDLALRLIDRGAKLISDDAVHVNQHAKGLQLHTPDNIAGKLEVRSLGIVDTAYVTAIELRLKVALCDEPDRYPFHQQMETIFDIPVASIAIAPHQASAPIKIEWALKQVLEQNFSQ